MTKEESIKEVANEKRNKGVILSIMAIALLLNASFVNVLIGLQCVEFVPDPEFLKWTNYLAFGAITVSLENYGNVRAALSKFAGNKFKINK